MDKKVQKDINRSEYYFLYSFDMAYKRRRTSKKGKCSKKNSVPFAVSLKSRKHKDTVTNLQVQKRSESLFQKRGKLGQSQQEGGFIGAILAATAPLSRRRSKKRYFIKMVKEFVLIEHREYNRLKDNLFTHDNQIVSDTAPGTTMLSTQHLLSTVKSKVGIMNVSQQSGTVI